MCNITFTSLELDSGANILTVTGTSDCQTIVVWLPTYSQRVSVPVVGGSWTAVFTSADADLVKLRAECGKEVKIDAFCEENENCRHNLYLVLKCGDEPAGNCCSMICCMVFKLLILLGLGFMVLSFIFTMCPIGICLRDAYVPIGLRVWGGILAFAGLLFWVVLCRPKKCDWIALLWQFFVLDGLLMIYIGFCPDCAKLLFIGVGSFVFGLLIFLWWMRACRVDRCRRLSEWTGLFLIPVNVLLPLLPILAGCVSPTTVAPLVFMVLVFFFELWLLMMLRKNKCIKC